VELQFFLAIGHNTLNAALSCDFAVFEFYIGSVNRACD
jgi:hypothetical protein